MRSARRLRTTGGNANCLRFFYARGLSGNEAKKRNDPTRGVDIETKREIYLALRAMAAEGKAIILLSTDTPELTHLCDRVMVFLRGRCENVFSHGEATEEAIVATALGIRSEATVAGA